MALRRERLLELLVFIISLILCIGTAEISMRVFLEEELATPADERSLTYKYDETLGWFPIKNSKQTYTGNRTIDVEHNSRGFRDLEHVVDTKPSIIFLGDSYVWGYDVETSERFTEKLREKLPGWSIYNLGVSGYGTDQEYILLQNHYDFYSPDIVFLVFCADNDEVDNMHNIRYGGYFKPYFIADKDSLKLQGVPVPKAENYFLVNHSVLAKSYWVRLLARIYFIKTDPPLKIVRNPTPEIITNMAAFINNRGSEFIIGLQDHHPELESFLIKKKIPYVYLNNPYRYSDYGNHWMPEGHTWVSEVIYEYLMKEGFIRY